MVISGPEDPRDVVRAGYDLVSYMYQNDSGTIGDEVRRPWVDRLRQELALEASVLDLGCGAGVPVARDLARDFTVTGVDISAVQIQRARRLVPQASFLQADMTDLDFPPHRFHAIVCLYAIIHLPVAQHRPLLGRMASWLKPGGVLLITVGQGAVTGIEQDWLGVPGATMYWSHADWSTYQQWFTELHFNVISHDFVREGDAGHHFVLARIT